MNSILSALNGRDGELDAWLEVRSEDEIRAAIKGIATPPAPAERETLTNEQIKAHYRAKHELRPDEDTTFFGHYLAGYRNGECAAVAQRIGLTSDRASLIAKVEARLSGAPPVDLWGAGYDTAIREVLALLRSPA
jgi:hypothetical protein